MCGNLQLCAGLEAGIEGATHALVQRRLDRTRVRRQEEEEAGELDEEEARGGVVAGLTYLSIETAGTEEEVAERFETALEMEMEETCEGEKGGEDTRRALGAQKYLTQDAESSGTTLVDAHNGFNKLSRLTMLWTVRHHWPAGARFSFNCYRHLAQLLLCQLGELTVIVLSI